MNLSPQVYSIWGGGGGGAHHCHLLRHLPQSSNAGLIPRRAPEKRDLSVLGPSRCLRNRRCLLVIRLSGIWDGATQIYKKYVCPCQIFWGADRETFLLDEVALMLPLGGVEETTRDHVVVRDVSWVLDGHVSEHMVVCTENVVCPGLYFTTPSESIP